MSFRVGGCRVSVSFLFTAVLAFLLFYDGRGASLSGLGAAACHEAGHLAAMGWVKSRPKELRFTPFGVELVRAGEEGGSYRQDMAVSLSGPAANLLLCALCFLLGWRDSLFFQGNLLLAAMNLLPIESLDGGQAMYSALCPRLGPKRAGWTVQVVSFLLLLPLACFSFLLLLRSHYNISLLLVTLYLVCLLTKRGRFF